MKSLTDKKSDSAVLMKMPDNVKSVSHKVEAVNVGDDYGTGTETAVSVNWVILAASVVGYNVFPNTTGFLAIPIILSVANVVIGAATGFIFFMEEKPSGINSKLRNLARLTDTKADTSSVRQKGVTISSWTKPSGQVFMHYWLPLRIFRKIKVHESITYFPYEDKYVKQTHYLSFRNWKNKQETFDGHRAVFKKALDSF
jgi:hypothetical protein